MDSASSLLALLAGAVAGGGLFLLIAAVRGLPPSTRRSSDRLRKMLRDLIGVRGAVALVAGLAVLAETGWLVGGVGIALLVLSWRGLTGAGAERQAIARLEGLATWTESVRDTIAGAVGLEQAIPASTRVASPALAEPLDRLVDRLRTRMPMPDALRRFADDLDDASADLIIAALIINSRLRGPGLRDLLGSLSGSVREELDARRAITAERRSTRRSVQIVVLVSVGLAVALALFNPSFLTSYQGVLGQAVLAVVAGIYAAGIMWLRKLATFAQPQRLLATPAGPGPATMAGSGAATAPRPMALAARGGTR